MVDVETLLNDLIKMIPIFPIKLTNILCNITSKSEHLHFWLIYKHEDYISHYQSSTRVFKQQPTKARKLRRVSPWRGDTQYQGADMSLASAFTQLKAAGVTDSKQYYVFITINPDNTTSCLISTNKSPKELEL